ncbi:MAG TPA: adenylate/guanylate cyclase domain-containing protein [Saprospiraceae bacterium]|nr:adenylate/guanylate cyclase domain-containing protein [Saprospiraceae bacterium]
MSRPIIKSDPTFETHSFRYFTIEPEGFNKKVFAQMLKEKFPGIDELVYLKNDFELTRYENIPGALSSYKMFLSDEGFLTYKEFFEGIPLENYLLNWKFNLPQFINIALKLTKLLKVLHSKKLIVKEFIIENILISPETQELRMCNLGCASSLLREVLDYNSEFSYYGSLWHIAPEQTGRVGRSLDYRADFYALGTILYQILCRRKPFNFTDSMELIHAHIAKTPVEPKNIFTGVPNAINEIVMRLLAKNPEERYQSEDGIIYDLNHSLREWQQTGTIKDFHLGSNDFSGIFCISEKLYGREKELKTLQVAWDSIKDSGIKLVLVAGYSGIGKTRLISEIRKPIFDSNAYFVSSKFDQLNRETPYSAFTSAFNMLINNILGEAEESIEIWKSRIRNNTNEDIAFICEWVPDLKLLVDHMDGLIDLGPVEGKKRLNKAFIDLLSIFESEKKQLALFIDDLQWADSDSLDLLDTLISSGLRNIMIIGAYRNNEVDASHPLNHTMNTLKEKLPHSLEEITLNDLSIEHVNQLISDSLRLTASSTRELSHVVHAKTRGNPFFVKQLLENLVDQKRIYFDRDATTWMWDLEIIRSIDISDYVVDLLIQKMSRLSPDTLEILSYAACIGNVFDIDTLCAISNLSEQKISGLLWELIRAEYISPIGQWVIHHSESDWEQLGIVKKGKYKFRFQHDRIQQAAYSLIKEEERENTHFKIGTRMLSSMSTEEFEEQIFDVLIHLNFGLKLISDVSQRSQLASYNLMAAKKALRNNAIRPALNHFKTGMELIGENQNSGYFKDLLIGQSECEYLTGNYKASEELFDRAIANAQSDYNKADILSRKMALYENTQRHSEAIETAYLGLRKLGMRLPVNPTQFHVLKELLTVKFLLRNKTPELLLNNKKMESKEKILMMKILMNLWGPVYLLQKQELLALKILKMVNLSIRYGNSIESALAFAFYGYVISAQLKDYKNGCAFARLGLQLNEKLNDKTLRSKVIVIAEGCVEHWEKPFNELIPNLREAYNAGIETNDIIYAGYATTFMNRNYFFAGEELNSFYQKLQGYFHFATKINSLVSQHQLLPWIRLVVDLLGVEKSPVIFGQLEDEDAHHQFVINLNKDYKLQLPLANYYTSRSIYHYIMDRHDLAFDFSKKADPVMASVIGLNEWTEQIIFKTLSALAYQLSGASLSGKERSMVKSNLKLMKKWAENAPDNYGAKYFLAMAESFAYEKKINEAIRHYDQAILIAEKSKLLYMSGLIYERYGRFLEGIKEVERSRKTMQQALIQFIQWGAKRKVESLVKLYDYLSHAGQTEGPSGTMSSAAFDLRSILEAAQALSGEVMFENLLEKMLLILIKNAGAQNAYFILPKNDQLFVEAASRMDNDHICEVKSYPLNESKEIYQSLVRRVLKTKETAIIHDLEAESRMELKEELSNVNAKSILSMPILSKGGVIAIVYLDNHLSTNVFTSQRLELLNLLSGQIAISIENARLYQNLEQKVQERTQTIEQQKVELEASKKLTEDLLLNILPSGVADELKLNGYCRPRRYESVTILFADFEKFTEMSEKLSPEEIVEIIDHHYKTFDRIIEKYAIEKIKTMGDAYLCVGGLPVESSDHSEKVIRASFEIIDSVQRFNEMRKSNNLPFCGIRIGVHTGTVVAGVVGHNKFAYDIWGDAVNTASRLQSAGEPGKVNISHITYEKVSQKFEFVNRGKIKVKNKADIDMYYVEVPINHTK